jgi:hypothetical protein
MTLPDEKTPGGLEALLAQAIEEKTGEWIRECVNAFLRCDKIEAHSWPPEKLDKARFHSMVAALNRDDPSKSASTSFKDPSPLIDVEAPCFDSVFEKVKAFCDAV